MTETKGRHAWFAWARGVLFAAGLGFAAWGQYACVQRDAATAAVWYAAGAALTVVSLWGSDPLRPRRLDPSPPLAGADNPQRAAPETRWLHRHGVPLLLLAAAVAPALFWRNVEVPPPLFTDEARAYTSALDFYSGKLPLTAWWDLNRGDVQPAVYHATLALLARVTGPQLSGFRAINAFWTLLTAVALYLFVAPYGGRLIAWCSAVGFAHTLWVVNLSRWGYSMSWAMLGAMLALAGTAHALSETNEEQLRSPPWHPRRWWAFALAAFGMGFAQYGYVSGRLVIPAVLASFLLAYLLHPQFIRQNWPGLAVFALVTGGTAVPWCLVLRKGTHLFLARAGCVGIQINIFQEQSFQPIWENLITHLKLFFWEGDFMILNNLPGEPLLHPIVVPAVALGLVVGAYHWRALLPFLPVLWLLALLPAGVLSNYKEPPKAHRILTMAPIFFVTAAFYLAHGRQLIEAAGRPSLVRRGALTLTGLVLVATTAVHAAREYDLYFEQYAKNPFLADSFAQGLVLMARDVDMIPAEQPVFVDEQFRSPQMDFLTYFRGTPVTYVHMAAKDIAPLLPAGGSFSIYGGSPSRSLLNPMEQIPGTQTRAIVNPLAAEGQLFWFRLTVPDAAHARALLTEQATKDPGH